MNKKPETVTLEMQGLGIRERLAITFALWVFNRCILIFSAKQFYQALLDGLERNKQ